ncbi:MAG: GTPase Era, partial [Candidatus Sumerlaeota bacterium]|nr:GTPase Era [Candidatus Sumerlaeota bacterium]
TRDRLAGIYTNEACQIVFVDTPGVIDPRDEFNEFLVGEAREAIEGVDVVLHLVEYGDTSPQPQTMKALLTHMAAPVFLVVNKIDLARAKGLRDNESILDDSVYDVSRYAQRFAISALRGEGLEALVDAIRERLPASEPFYDREQLCDRDLRYLAAERVREKVFELAHEEIPYGVATRTEEFREQPDPQKTYISVTIFVERDSQKGIVIGKNGAMIKAIGQAARREIEELAGGPVFLELGVKVQKNWRKDATALREFGYAPRRAKGKKKRR